MRFDLHCGCADSGNLSGICCQTSSWKRSPDGELFGFERTGQVSRFRASEIATRTRQFGQEDDITVIKLDWQSHTLAPVRA